MVTNYYQGNGEPLQATTISPRIFRFLKRYTDHLLPHERLVVLSFNEYAFRDYVPMTPDGYNGGQKLPSHLVVPCIKFVVSKRFHLLGSLFFHSEYLTKKPDKFSKDMSECIKLYILALENVNLKVIATVCPLSAVFHHAVEILTQVPYMEEFDGPLVYSVGRNKEIVHIHDPRYVRDGFIRWFMLFDLQFTLNGKHFETSRYDIIDVLELNNRPPLLEKATSNNKYYHQISRYYFNEHISVAMRRLIKQGYLNSQAIGTSIFINMFRQLFHRIYGLNDEECEIFDFGRMNEYIEFIKSIHPAHCQYMDDEEYQQEVAASLPQRSKVKPKRDLNNVELSKQTPSTYSGLYSQKETSLESFKQEDMYESIMITTSSGKSFVPIQNNMPSKKSTKSKNKKKNRKDRKKQQIIGELEVSSDPKDDLLLLYQNPSRNPPDNGEFLLCTPEKYEEMQLSSRKSKISPENNNSHHSEENEDQVKSRNENSTRSDKKEKKILSPVQNINDILDRSLDCRRKEKNSDQNTLHNTNLNENIRKYKNVNKNNMGAVRKIDLEDESNKENITKSFITSTSDSMVNMTSNKMENLNLDDEIKEISYSISDPDDSTEYQFEQNYVMSKNDENFAQDVYIASKEEADICSEILSKETIETLVQKYLSKEQVKNLMQTDSTMEKSPKFDSFIKYLKDRNLQYAALLNDAKSLMEPAKRDYVKISMNANDRVDIERVSAESIQPPPLDLFGISRHDWALNNQCSITDSSPISCDMDKKDDFCLNMHDVQQNHNLRRQTHNFTGCKQINITLGAEPIEDSQQNVIKISSDGIHRVSTDLSGYDPLKINEHCQSNVELKDTRRLTLDISDTTSDDSSPNTSKVSNYYSTHPSHFEEYQKQSQIQFGEQCATNESLNRDCYGYFNEESVRLPFANNLNIQKSDVGIMNVLGSTTDSTTLNNASTTGCRLPLLPIPKLDNLKKNTNTENKRYLNLQRDCSSDSDGDFVIVDRLKKEEGTKVQQAVKDPVKYGTFPNEPSDKFFSLDFNSEYDDFDDMVINKHVKMIISKLEEKEEEIARVIDTLDTVEKAIPPATSRESSTKRTYVKKEIYRDGDNLKTGAIKRTIFHRDKTEESTATPKIVIKHSENSCDKSKIATTKMNYNETLGVKNKKQLARIRKEQYKKVANTISQTIKRFSNIFNLPDSDEQKTTRISRASLDFVYDLKKVNDVLDVSMKQELLDDAYDKLCLSILGRHAKNPNIQDKMKELMPILQEIASPRPTYSDSTADIILSQHVNKTISSAGTTKDACQSTPSQYIREDVQNLWINNIRGISRVFKRLGAEKIYFELTPAIFTTDHVEHMMDCIQTNGPHIESYRVDERCLPVDIAECFDTLKPYGSTILIDD